MGGGISLTYAEDDYECEDVEVAVSEFNKKFKYFIIEHILITS